MSRDRLAQRRAQQAAENEQQQGSHQQDYDYDYDNDNQSGYPSQAQAGYGAYGRNDQHAQAPAANYTSNYEDMNYLNQYAQASTASLNGAPPPSYKSRHEDDTNNNRETRRRANSRSNTDERNRGYDSRRQQQQQQQRSLYPPDDNVPSMPEPQLQDRYSPYGGREDQRDPHFARNQSSVALNTRPSDYRQQRQQEPQRYGNFDQPDVKDSKRGKRTKQDSQQEEYEIPTLSKGSRQQQQQPLSPPYSARPSNAATPSAAGNVISDAPEVDMSAFFEELDAIRDSIREMDEYVTYLDQLHSRSLTGSGGDGSGNGLQDASSAMRKLTNTIRKRIKALQETTRIRTHGQAEQDRQVRKTQIEGLKNKFLEIVQNYQNMEMKHRDKSKQRIERQYQIVKPDASPEEIRQAVEGGQEVQIFAQALRQSNRVGNAQGVLNEVQSRHEDIKQIERTLVELFQLFQDMGQMVEEQDEQIILIEEKAEAVAQDVEQGHKEIKQAVVSSKKARKKRKCCCWIMLILFLIIAGVVAYLVVKVIIPKINENKAKNEAADEKATKTVTQSAQTRTQQALVNTGVNAGVNTNANANVNVSTVANAGNTAVGNGNTATGAPVVTGTSKTLRLRARTAAFVDGMEASSPGVTARAYLV